MTHLIQDECQEFPRMDGLFSIISPTEKFILNKHKKSTNLLPQKTNL